MSFAAAVDHLHALAQELSPAAPRRKFDLDHMRILARALGDPQQRFPSILIAGTNGKGSTAATLASILTAAGLRTGLYTSPHLTRVTERIRVSEPLPAPAPETPTPLREISEPEFARLYFQVNDTARTLVADGHLPHPPSFFEALTALAFLYFAERQVEFAILEVGLGGRLDATNIVEPVLSVVTDIALDHQEYLGNTIAEIAREKAGILRPGGTLITLPQHPEANQAIGEAAVALNVRGVNAADYLPGRELATESGAPFMARSHRDMGGVQSNTAGAPFMERSDMSGVQSEPTVRLPPNHYDLSLSGETLHVRSPLPGEHQRRNIALAIAAAIELRTTHGLAIPNSAIESGIANTSWPGRLEFLPPNLLLDVAHNSSGAWTLRAAIAALPESMPRTLLFSCLRDKDLTELARILFPLFDSPAGAQPQHHIVFSPIPNPRAASLDDLAAAARALDIPAEAAPTPEAALALARAVTPPGGLIIATGSIFLIGALRDLTLQR